jgi:hypothetical protein
MDAIAIEKNPIQPVASDCSRTPPNGRCDRSIGPMLSRPRKPMSRLPSTANTSSAAHACTGGFTSPKSHSYAGSAPPGCWNHSRHSRISWYLANEGSTWASATQWKARSQAANQGVLPFVRHRHDAERVEIAPPGVAARLTRGSRWRLRRVAVEPAGHVVVVRLLAPQHPGTCLAHDHRLVGGRGRRHQPGVELVGLGAAPGDSPVEIGTERLPRSRHRGQGRPVPGRRDRLSRNAPHRPRPTAPLRSAGADRGLPARSSERRSS